MPTNDYILITPAKNEEAYIEKTLKSVVNQTILPKQWVIISDGSTDRTDEIVKKYTARYQFITLIRRNPKSGRNFASKVYAIQDGFREIENDDFMFYGNLDGDVSFEPDYYERLLEKFALYPKLGVTGGKVYDLVDGKFKKQVSGLHSVAGPIQFFRRSCWEEIGGYVASRYGLVDAIAEVTARMRGWETKTFPELKVSHFRKTGSEGRSIWAMQINQGKKDYILGYHPIWHLARSIQEIKNKPIFLGSLFRTLSYIFYLLTRKKRPVSKEFVKFLQREELRKLKFIIKDFLKGKRDIEDLMNSGNV